MDAILIILGVLGFGAIVISTYVFTVAARTYVSEDERKARRHTDTVGQPHYVARQPIDRRNGKPVTFPLTVNGILIANDRRSLFDRRMA